MLLEIRTVPVNINFGVRAGKNKLGVRTGKYKLGTRAWGQAKAEGGEIQRSLIFSLKLL